MAAKDIALKKQLIKEAIIGAGALVLFFGAGMLLSNYDDDALSQKRIKENESSTVRSEHDAIQLELGTGFEVSAFYDAYIKHHNGDLTLKRDEATQMMSLLREKNHLTNLAVTISPVSDVTTPEFGAIKSGTLTKSEVKLVFGGVTDNSVYNFISDLQRKLPGIVVIEDVKLTRGSEVSRSMLVDLSQHKLSPLISGELTFLWLGVRPTDESSSKGQNHGL